jgi:hypothetical protein
MRIIRIPNDHIKQPNIATYHDEKKAKCLKTPMIVAKIRGNNYNATFAKQYMEAKYSATFWKNT